MPNQSVRRISGLVCESSMTSAIHKFCQLVLKEIIKALFDFPLSNLREMNTSDKKLFALGEMRGLFGESMLKTL